LEMTFQQANYCWKINPPGHSMSSYAGTGKTAI